MQVFLPYPDFAKSVQSLDSKRLGNQVYRECLTLYRGGWPNHPVSQIWANYKGALALYAFAGAVEMCKRPNWREEIKTKWFVFWLRETCKHSIKKPPFVGNTAFHISHQSNLVRKNPDHYKGIFKGVPDNLEYVWPQ